MSQIGKVVIFSGPSGVGKSTLLKRVFERCRRPLQMSISATTRPPREGETDGIAYHFLSAAEFENRLKNDDFLESCEVFGRGYFYGTLMSEVTPSLEQGKWVVLEIDVSGMKEVLAKLPESITIFVRPSSLDVLEQRLRNRRTESEAAILRRLEVARSELKQANRYQHQVINDDLDQAVDKICNILESID